MGSRILVGENDLLCPETFHSLIEYECLAEPPIFLPAVNDIHGVFVGKLFHNKCGDPITSIMSNNDTEVKIRLLGKAD